MMRRIVPLVFSCLLLAGCSAQAPASVDLEELAQSLVDAMPAQLAELFHRLELL